MLWLTVAARVSPAQDADVVASRCQTSILHAEENGRAFLPHGNIFCPLLADPRAPRSSLSVFRLTSPNEHARTMAMFGIGDAIPAMRWGSTRRGAQLGLEGVVLAQFDLGDPSFDLLNADFIGAIPLTLRSGRRSLRLRAYHQSSHIGDELLARPEHPDREDVSFEAVDAIASLERGAWRWYAGGEYLAHRSRGLATGAFRAGAELRPTARVLSLGSFGIARFVGATDLTATRRSGWHAGTSVRMGLEFDRAPAHDPSSRRWSLLGEAYDGPSPHGQFYRTTLRYVGLGLHFAF